MEVANGPSVTYRYVESGCPTVRINDVEFTNSTQVIITFAVWGDCTIPSEQLFAYQTKRFSYTYKTGIEFHVSIASYDCSTITNVPLYIYAGKGLTEAKYCSMYYETTWVTPLGQYVGDVRFAPVY